MTIDQQALQRALALLKIGQVEYHLRLPDGRELLSDGFQPLASKQKRRHNHFAPHYIPLVKNLQPGDTCQVPVPEGLDVVKMTKTVSSWCCAHWGRGNVMTESDKEARQVLVARVA